QKDLLPVFGGDAGAVVDDLHHGTVLLDEEVDHHAPVGAPGVNRFQCVLHDVGKNLAQALAVGQGRHVPVHATVGDVDAARPPLGPHGLDHGVEDPGDLVLSPFELRVSREVQQAVDDALDLDDA